MTLAEIRTKVRRDIGFDEDDLVTDVELDSYINEGISEAEREILTLYEGYFLDKEYLATLTLGTSEYDLPSDIYANKLRAVIYKDNNDYYEIEKVSDTKDMFKEIEYTEVEDTNADYRYYITNDATDGIKLNLFPTSRETSATAIRLWYIRNAAQLALDADECDIPEFQSFVIWYAKTRCLQKKGIDPMLQGAVASLQNEKRMMVETLANMTPDGSSNIIRPCTEFYEDFDSDGRR